VNNSLEIIKTMVDDLTYEGIKLLSPIVLELTAKDWSEVAMGLESDRRMVNVIDFDYEGHKRRDSISYHLGYVEVVISKKKALLVGRVAALKQELAALERM